MNYSTTKAIVEVGFEKLLILECIEIHIQFSQERVCFHPTFTTQSNFFYSFSHVPREYYILSTYLGNPYLVRPHSVRSSFQCGFKKIPEKLNQSESLEGFLQLQCGFLDSVRMFNRFKKKIHLVLIIFRDFGHTN